MDDSTPRPERPKWGSHRREEIRERLHRYLDVPLLIASLLFLLLTLIELTGDVSPRWQPWVSALLYGLWALFIVEFAAELALARDRLHYLRTHWLDTLAVLLPFLRILRAFAILRVTRVLPALRLLIFGGRGSTVAIRLFRRRRLGQFTLITVLVILVGAALAFLFEVGARGSTIRTFGDALWWSAGIVTTVSNELYPVTASGRILGFLLMVYAMVFFTYFTASLASILVGSDIRLPGQQPRGGNGRKGGNGGIGGSGNTAGSHDTGDGGGGGASHERDHRTGRRAGETGGAGGSVDAGASGGSGDR